MSKVVAATTTIVVGAAVTSSPTVARERGRSELRYLLSAQAFFCILLCAHFLSLADHHPGWRDEGGAAAGAAILGMKGKLFYCTMRLIRHTRPATVVHALLVELQEAGGWRNPACCRWCGIQPAVEPVPAGGAALYLHTTATHNGHLKGGERWGVSMGCRLTGSIGWGRSASDKGSH